MKFKLKNLFVFIICSLIYGCGGPAHVQGADFAAEIGKKIFMNHGCINEAKKNLEYCGDISVHFSAGWNVSHVVIDGAVNYEDIHDVMSLIRAENLKTDLEVEFKQKKLSLTLSKDE